MGITEDIRRIKEARTRMLAAAREEEKTRTPRKHDPKEIPAIYREFTRVASHECRDNSRIFVLLVYYMFKPESLAYGSGCRGDVRCETARVLHVGCGFVSKLFAQAKFLMANNREFRIEAERVFAGMNT